jgi:hypothetical protein
MSAMVVGGMVGGGIYVALGVVIEAAGKWAWLSFVIAGVVAVSTAHSYADLSNHFEVGGGAFEFLEKMDRGGAAGSLSWVLLGAYTLTIALYAFAFGQYVAYAFGAGDIVVRILSLVVIASITGLNLWGSGKLASVEIAIVSTNVAVLVLLGVAGLFEWSPSQLTPSSGPKEVWAAGVGAAAIFVSYEGFQLLTYEYESLDRPKLTLKPVLVWSSLAVVAIYVLVAVGATMILGADTAVEQKTVALSVAASKVLGQAGLILMTVAAAFATSAAINSTLFSTAMLARRVAGEGELPSWLDRQNASDIPYRAVIVIAALAVILSMTGSLSSLVEAASLGFLAAFGAVNVIALTERVGARWVPASGLAVGSIVGAILVYRLATTKPIALAIMLGFIVLSFVGRPFLLRHSTTE